MTCGVCSPKAFRSKVGGRLFGYLVANTPDNGTLQARDLYYLGAEHVFSDAPHGNVRYRPGLRRLRKVMRPGDKLVIASMRALGTKLSRAEANCALIESDGVEIAVMCRNDFD